MTTRKPATALLTLLSVLPLAGLVLGLSVIPGSEASATANSKPEKIIANRRCMKCHNDEDDKTHERDDGTVVNIYIDARLFEQSVHGEQHCVSCHATIKKAKHRRPLPGSVGCVECHRELQAQQASDGPDVESRLDVVIAEIDGYMDSVHARPNPDGLSSVNATCFDCHDAHTIGGPDSAARASFRQRNVDICGRCHVDQRKALVASAHGRKHEPEADSRVPGPQQLSGAADSDSNPYVDNAAPAHAAPPQCSDCHRSHNIHRTQTDSARLAVTDQCGDCHESQLRTYLMSYHGQVARLGYAHTAACYDCHGSHAIAGSSNPGSMIHPDNRLQTCRECHGGAPAAFVDFHAHGDPSNPERYPEMWIAQRFMDVMIVGVFMFFWTHMLLWGFREWLDRRQGKGPAPDATTRERLYVRRFSAGWRALHLTMAIVIMTLAVTGMALLFSDQSWARYVMQLIGGPQVSAALHRIAAVILAIGFFGHLLVVFWKIRRSRGRFDWFGPTSLVPTLGDINDIGRMFKWFFGLSPRPDFERWSYWEKFDYWAPFWGMAVIGLSGLMLWFPNQTGAMLPGWSFNVATIVHAEEAVLATVFLFTVHFFNVHFRPNKFPMDTVMVTGVIPLEEFKHEHRLEYERLNASGRLESHLIAGPSGRARRIGRIVTGGLIVVGLVLAALVLTGYTERIFLD